jgi:hypothetical protein
MEGNEPTIDEARAELIRLLQLDECRITQRAEADGRQLLRRYVPIVSQYAIFRFVLERLLSGHPLHAIERGRPAGSLPRGYVMNNADDAGLYIELTIEDGNAWVISFHTSKHYKGE